jgi:23S rRNA (cytidine2498-2'-O)-methyltransferase
MPPSDRNSTFLFVTCQVGAEPAVKEELARRWPDVHAAYARPGLITFKVPPDHPMRPDFDLRSVFARASGLSLGQASGDDATQRAHSVWDLLGPQTVARVHVWPRDVKRPGEDDFEPSITPAAVEVREAIRQACPRPEQLDADDRDWRRPARSGELVLDVILVEPQQWLVGYHQATSQRSLWPGGMMPLELPPDAVSRAWLKMEEALRWSSLPIPPSSRVAELGSAPGGASQALLSHGLIVMGVDPAEMDARVLANPNFTHLRRRAVEVRRREFRRVHWLTADMNVAPSYTLDAVEAIVTHPEVNIRGMLITLKLFQWQMAREIPSYLDRVRSWGYNLVSARQLQHDRQEICVAALQSPFIRKPVRRR